MTYYCYLLRSTNNPNYTYIGITNNLQKRLEQHNGILKGGAKATRRFNDWEIHIYICFPTREIAQSFEWKWKHEFRNNKWYRTRAGIDNKLKRLHEIIEIFSQYYPKVIEN